MFWPSADQYDIESNQEVSHSLEQALERVRTGDIVLFQGKGFLSDVIRGVSAHGDRWSHIGIVVRRSKDTPPLLLESTKDTYPVDIISGVEKAGAKVVDLKEKIMSYGGYNIVYRRLHARAPAKNKRMAWTDMLWDFAASIDDSDYEGNISELIGSIFRSNEPNCDSYFCVELVAHCLMLMGVLSNDIPSNDYQLYDFSDQGYVPLNEGYSFGHEHRIT